MDKASKIEIENQKIDQLIRQYNQPTLEEVNYNLTRSLQDNPAQVLGTLQQNIVNQVREEHRPALVNDALYRIQQVPDFNKVYGLDSVQKKIRPYIENHIATYGKITDNDLKAIATDIMDIVVDARKVPVDNGAVKRRAATVETKGTQGEPVTRDVQEVYEERIKAIQGLKRTKKDRKEFAKWVRSSEGNKILNKVFE